MQNRKVMAALLGLMLPARPALADGIAPFTLPVDTMDLILGGVAQGAVFAADQPGSAAAAAGSAKLTGRLQRSYDTGLILSLNATLAAHDRLSFGRYDGDALEKLYGEASTGLGTVRLGLTDGAAAELAVAGPAADAATSLNDPATTFFRDGAGHALADSFSLRTPGGPSSNYAKIVYESPDLTGILGIRLAISFAPTEGKNVLPFLAAGPHVPGRQADMWEGALGYSTDFGPLSVSTYAAASFGRAEHKLPGQEGVSDYALGLRGDYTVSDDLTVSLGGAWHSTNAYGFDINRSYDGAATRILHLSGGVAYGSWAASAEYGEGTAGSVPGSPRLTLNGKGVALSRRFDDSVTASLGWQHLTYGRGAGTFYDGSGRLSLDALYLHLSLRTTQQ